MRLNDQFIQEWQGAISTSSRFVTRRALSIDYKLPVYIDQIRIPDIRLIYTRLRADMNISSTSRASKEQYETCPLCQSQPETVTHFILRCPFLQTERCHFFDCVKNFSPHLSMKSDLQKPAYILDLGCLPESIRVCCKYIYKGYMRRERCVVWNICIPSDTWLFFVSHESLTTIAIYSLTIWYEKMTSIVIMVQSIYTGALKSICTYVSVILYAFVCFLCLCFVCCLVCWRNWPADQLCQ